MEFLIPLSREDLLPEKGGGGGGGGGYTVSDLLSPQELTSRIEECQTLFADNGPNAINDSFDIFYNVIHHFDSITQTVREHYWNIIIEALVDSCRIAANVVSMETVDKLAMRSNLKMLLYIVCQFVEQFESLLMNQEKPIQVTKNRKSKKSSHLAGDGGCGLMWEGERERVLITLTQFLEQDLVQFWDPPTTEMLEDVTNMIAGVCYKMLENPNVCRIKDLRGPLSSLLGIIVKKYNQKLSASVKLVQLIQNNDHCVTALSNIIKLMINEYDTHSFVSDIIKEITDIDPQDMSVDTSGTKNYSLFLTELSQLVAKDMIMCVEPLTIHLGGESYTMRNAVLSVFGEIISEALTGSEISTELRNTREILLDRLSDHIHDVNAFVRSKSLQIWQHLCETGAIPLTRQKHLLPLVTGRVRDKSSVVRKNALLLLTIFITHNPYGPQLSLDKFKNDLTREEEKLRQMIPKSYQQTEEEGGGEKEEGEGGEEEGGEKEGGGGGEGEGGEGEGGGEEEEGGGGGEGGEDVYAKKQEESEDTERGEEDGAAESETKEIDEHKVEVAKQMAVVQYHKDAVTFVEEISKCLPSASQLLGSKLNTDICEALEFLVAATQFNIATSQEYINKSLVLAWSSEQLIKDLLMSVYLRLYLTPPDSCPPNGRHTYIASNLIGLVSASSTSHGELASLQQLMIMLFDAGHVTRQAVAILWEVFAGRFPGCSPANSLASLILLTMIGESDTETLRNNLPLLLEHGIKRDDLILTKWTCIALQKLSGGRGNGRGLRFEPSHDIFVKISGLLLDTFESQSSMNWCPLAEQAVVLIYKLSEMPDTVMERVVKGMCRRLFGDVGGAISQTTPTDTTCGGAGVSFERDSVPPPSSVSSLSLSRLFFIMGQNAKQVLVHIEVNISKEMKRRRAAEPTTSSTSNGENGSGTKTKDTNDNDDIGLSSATDEDIEAELFKKVLHNEVCGSGLLGSLLPLLVTVVTKPGVYSSLQLQSAATLALSKYMLLSSKLCDQYLRLLFTLLESSPEAVIRSNAIVALGDLTVRYPNLIEPWTPNLYSRLRDPVFEVRHNTVIVLTHLILNDMVKVKGQISEMALCLEDDEQRIVDRTKLFFHELSQKGNALYNVIPDIISHLSDPTDSKVSPDTFRNIMKYLLSFVQRERQNEGLIEKLCHRFRAARSEQQSRDIAFCLSQLSISERGFRKLQENLPCYQGLLSDIEIYNCLITIITKGKKLAKADKKTMLDEFEARLTEIHKKGLEDQENNQPNMKLNTPSQSNNDRDSAVKKTKGTARKRPSVTPSSSRRHDDNITNSALSSARRAGMTSAGRGGEGGGVSKPQRRTKRKKVQIMTSPLSVISDSDND